MSGKIIGKEDVCGRREEDSEVMAYLKRRISCETGSCGRQRRHNVERLEHDHCVREQDCTFSEKKTQETL
jgi:hypothetical protein